MKWWVELFSEPERRAYAQMEKGVKFFTGTRPALLVVDVVKAFVGEPGLSLEEASREWVTACGPAAWEALPRIKALLDDFRAARLPVCFTTGQPGAAAKFGGTNKAELSAMASPMDRPGAQDIPDLIQPQPEEWVLDKPKASAFFATPLLAWLHHHSADSVVIVGCTTSGCVRATCVDAMSWGYPTAVIEDACFDRSKLSHGVSLFEMHTKYADVLTVDEFEKERAADFFAK